MIHHYYAYLLRVWSDGDPPVRWYFSLEDTRTQVRRGFASLDELLHYLEQENGLHDGGRPAGLRLPEHSKPEQENE